jgi:uracil-DNA glycosylase
MRARLSVRPRKSEQIGARVIGRKNARALARLGILIRRCIQCPLHESRRQAVPGEGNPYAAIFLVGEAPGKFEDQQGCPFCGHAGQFLDRLLQRCGLKRSDVFITNSVKCRPRNNRAPRSTELQTCYEHWLRRQIEIIDPKVVVLLGKIPVLQLLHMNRSLKESHGRFYRRASRLYQVQYHPAAGMRFPNLGAAMKQDFDKLKRVSLIRRRGHRNNNGRA